MMPEPAAELPPSADPDRDAASRPIRTVAKRTLAERIAEKRGIGQLLALAIIQDVLDEIANELVKGNRCEFRDFGVFETVHRRPRMALNPKTMEKVPVQARTVVKFKPGRDLKAKVKGLPAPAEGADDAGAKA